MSTENKEMMELAATEAIEAATENNGNFFTSVLTIGLVYTGCRVIESGVVGLYKAGKKKLAALKARKLQQAKEEEVVVTTEVEDVEKTYPVNKD